MRNALLLINTDVSFELSELLLELLENFSSIITLFELVFILLNFRISDDSLRHLLTFILTTLLIFDGSIIKDLVLDVFKLNAFVKISVIDRGYL